MKEWVSMMKLKKSIATISNVEPYRFDARIDLFNLYLKTNQNEKAREIATEILYLPLKIPSKKMELLKEKIKSYLKNDQNKKAE